MQNLILIDRKLIYNVFIFDSFVFCNKVILNTYLKEYTLFTITLLFKRVYYSFF